MAAVDSSTLRIVQPPHPFSRCLDDLADCLADALTRAGRTVERTTEFAPGRPGTEIVVGAHARAVTLPNYPVIVYQTEIPTSKFWTPNYLDRLRSAMAVWDAGRFDYELPAHIKRAVLEPGLMNIRPTALETVRMAASAVSGVPQPKDIDLLFYGSLSERRVELLTRLHDAGLGIDVHFNVFGAERNALIDRAKVVVDIKQHEGDPDDATRTFYLDSRGACVLSENDRSSGRRLRPNDIVFLCKHLLGSEENRRRHAKSRREELKPMDATTALAALDSGNCHVGSASGELAHVHV